MNNLARISLILNGVLILAVAALYYIVFSQPDTAAPQAAAKPHIRAEDSVGPEKPATLDGGTVAPVADNSPMAPMAIGRGEGIYFVNTDTLLEKYNTFRKAKQALEARSTRFERDMQNRMGNLQNEMMQAQQKVQSGAVPQSQIQELEQQMMEKQQQLAQYRDQEGQRILEEEQKLNKRLNDDIQKFMKSYAGRRGYRYVLGYATANANILYASDSLDITDEVVRGLNKK